MSDAQDTASRIRLALGVVIDEYVQTLPNGVKSIQGGGMPGAASKEAQPLIPHHVLDVRLETHADLKFWARFIMGEVKDINGRSLTVHLRSDDPIGLAKFIKVWADQLAKLEPEDASNCADDFERHGAALRGIVNSHRSTGVVVGKCPLLFEDVACAGTVRAELDEPIKCERCGTKGAVEWWHALIFGASELAPLVTARELVGIIATKTGQAVDTSTIRKWVERGKIEHSGWDEKGRALYDHAIVCAIVRAAKVA